MILMKREREFIENWLKVVSGEMDKLDFYRKWSTQKDERSFLDDYKAVQQGKMTLEEFKRKWTARGDWKNYIRVMRCRVRKKKRLFKKVLCIGRGLAAIRVNRSKVDNFYLFYSLMLEKSRLETIGGGSTFKGITKKSLEELKVSLPPLEEQKKITQILSKWDEVIEVKKAKKEKLERMKKKVMELMLTGKVRIK